MKARRGVALFAALWLVVALAVVALQFSLEARDRTLTALNTLELADARAVAHAGVEHALARLERARRQPVLVGGAGANSLRAADPWLDADSLFAFEDTLASARYTVQVADVGATININEATQQELRQFLTRLDIGAITADDISQCIMDWRDTNIQSRARGAERDQYIEDDRLVLPRDGPFQKVSELLHVMHVTPEIYDSIAPFLRVDGDVRINVNSAPLAVLTTLPGFTDASIATIMQLRNQGRRITSVNELRQLLGSGGASLNNNRVTVTTTELRITSIGWNKGRRTAVRIDALVQGSGTATNATARVVSRRTM